jgi:hypothetical protein
MRKHKQKADNEVLLQIKTYEKQWEMGRGVAPVS